MVAEEKAAQPGGGTGRPYFEVTMEVPGMQVSGKVDARVGSLVFCGHF